MLDRTNLTSFKEKFGTFLSKLYYSASLSLEQISFKAAFTDILSFTERDRLKWFMDKEYNELAKIMYNVSLKHESNDVNPVFWAGIQYINIFLTKKIPLRQIFVLCPLEEMVAHYKIYHEMNETALIEEFMNNEYKRSILSLLIKERKTTFTKLAYLTGINLNTLKSYARCNEMLFKASSNNIHKLMDYFDVSEPSVFSKETTFISINTIFEDNNLKEKLINHVKRYLDIDGELCLYDRDYRKNDTDGLYIGVLNLVYYKNKLRVLRDEEVIFLARKN